MIRIVSKLLVFFLLILILTTCIDTNVTIRINPNGKASVKIKYTALNEYGVGLIKEFKQSLVREGYVIIKDNYNQVEGIIYDDLQLAFTENTMNADISKFKNRMTTAIGSKDAKLNVNIQNNLLKKIITIDYFIPKDESFDNEANGEWEAMANGLVYGIMEKFTMNFLISIPGKIVETTGKIASENTAKWSFDLLNLLRNGKRIYIKSEINLSPVNQLSAQKRTESKIIKYYEEIDNINFEIVKLKEMTKNQQKINKNIKTKKNEADKILLKSLNTLITIYHQDKGKYPTGLEEIKQYSKKHFDDIPAPFNGEIVYNVKNHSFKIIK